MGESARDGDLILAGFAGVGIEDEEIAMAVAIFARDQFESVGFAIRRFFADGAIKCFIEASLESRARERTGGNQGTAFAAGCERRGERVVRISELPVDLRGRLPDAP